MTQALYRKWRPQSWADIVGQQHVVRTLQTAVAGGRAAHAYLFAGPRGTGKTSTARILAKGINCLAEDTAARPCNDCAHCKAVNAGAFMDLIEIDAASNTSVEDVRDLRDRIAFSPAEGRQKVYIIDEVHMLSTAAFNALLKTLEEPPAHVLFILATTEAHKIPATVISRCQRHEFRRLSLPEMEEQLREIAGEEGWSVETEALEAVARQATGSLRDAVSLLDQLGSLGGDITFKRTLEVLGAAGNEAVQRLAQCIAEKDTASGLQVIHQATDAGTDARQFARQTVEYLRGVMLAATGNADLIEAAADTRDRMSSLAAAMETDYLLRAIRAFSQAAADTRSGWRPQLPLELALMESIGPASRNAPTSRSDQPTSPCPGGQPGSEGPAKSQPTLKAVSPSNVPSALPAGQDSPAALSLARARDAWERALNIIRQRDHRLHTILSSATVESADSDGLILGFAADLMREKGTRPETLTAAQTALAEVLGRPLRVRCTTAKARVAESGTTYSEGGMVDTAARELGAQVIDLP